LTRFWPNWLRIRASPIVECLEVNEEETMLAPKAPNAEKKGLPREQVSLDRRYGRIGISALVAALRYRSEAKNRPETAATTHTKRHKLGAVA
jgi:hypothetical protein